MLLFFAPHPLIASLEAIEIYLNMESRGWQSSTDDQRKLIKGEYADRYDLGFFRRGRELKTFAGESAAKLNEKLKEEGFDIRLDELGDNGVGAVAVLKAIFDWISKPTRSSANIGGLKYATLKFEEGFTVMTAINHNFPIVRLEAMGGYEVFITVQGDKRTIPTDGFVLQRTIGDIMTYAKKVSDNSDFFSMPMIKAKADIDVSWMNGLTISQKGKRTITIGQAKEQVMLSVDEKGVQAEVAAAAGTRGVQKQGLVVNEPFFIMIKKAGIKKGVLYGYIDSNGWVEVPR